jgi:predicted secreted hydrolase
MTVYRAGCAALLLLSMAGCFSRGDAAAERPSGIAALQASGAAGDGFERATGSRVFDFPADHGSHPRYRNEWWYFTGNLVADGGARYGFELTFFRIATSAQPPDRQSAWATNQIWMAHFALTDGQRGKFFAAQRLAREALGVAGAEADPFGVWVKDWSVRGAAGTALPTFELRAADGDQSLELRLQAEKPVALHGDAGLDLKGPEPGNASYYYSIPRLNAQGHVRVEGRDFAVSGLAWMDREWSTSALSPGIAGWDWFALHLADGRDLMYYRLRRADGGSSEYSKGSLIAPDGSVRRLAADDVQLDVRRQWRSATSGIDYPVEWRLRIPEAGIDLDLAPLIDGQEIDLGVRYWEGAVLSVESSGERPAAEGYLELAGYGDVPSAQR